MHFWSNEGYPSGNLNCKLAIRYKCCELQNGQVRDQEIDVNAQGLQIRNLLLRHDFEDWLQWLSTRIIYFALTSSLPCIFACLILHREVANQIELFFAMSDNLLYLIAGSFTAQAPMLRTVHCQQCQ